MKKQEYNIKDLVSEINFSENEIKDYGNGIIVTKGEEELFKLNGFSVKDYSSLKELIFDVTSYLDDDGNSDDADDLDYILSVMSERNYYRNTIK